jgi:Bacterial lectin
MTVTVDSLYTFAKNNIDLQGILGAEEVIWGFTASSGAFTNTNKVCMNGVVSQPNTEQCVESGERLGTTGAAKPLDEVEGCYTVLDNTAYDSGAVWSCNQINITKPFIIKTVMYFGNKDDEGADGMIFTLQTQGISALGDIGSDTGDNGITPRFGVMFRTWYGDGDQYDSIGFLSTCNDPSCEVLSEVDIGFELEDGQDHTVEFDWNPYKRNSMKVTVDTIHTFTRSDIDLKGILGSDIATWGVTASSYRLTNTHKVCVNDVILKDEQCLDDTSYSIIGAAEALPEDKCFNVLNDTQYDSGAVWSCKQISVTKPFTIKADMYFGNKDVPGGDGMVFTLQTKGFDALGTTGADSGDNGITPRFGVKLRTWWGDNSIDSIAFVRNCNASFCIQSTDYTLPFELEDGNDHAVEFNWDPYDAEMTVTIDTVHIFKQNEIDLVGILGSDVTYWGFTASSGVYSNTHKVCVTDVIEENARCTDAGSFSTKGAAKPLPKALPTDFSCFSVLNQTVGDAGAIWACQTINIEQPFQLYVDMNFGSDAAGGDGMVFTLQTQGLDALGTPSGESGSNGITPQYGVLFRTWSGDAFDYIGFLSNCTESYCGKSPEVKVGLELEDGQDHLVKFDWNPSNNNKMTVVIDSQYTFSQENINLQGILGSNEAVWGFTASSGAVSNYHKVCFRNLISIC